MGHTLDNKTKVAYLISIISLIAPIWMIVSALHHYYYPFDLPLILHDRLLVFDSMYDQAGFGTGLFFLAIYLPISIVTFISSIVVAFMGKKRLAALIIIVLAFSIFIWSKVESSKDQIRASRTKEATELCNISSKIIDPEFYSKELIGADEKPYKQEKITYTLKITMKRECIEEISISQLYIEGGGLIGYHSGETITHHLEDNMVEYVLPGKLELNQVTDASIEVYVKKLKEHSRFYNMKLYTKEYKVADLISTSD